MPPLPDLAQILDLEQVARRQGCGLRGSDLHGGWRLQRVWGRERPGTDRPAEGGMAALSAPLLRALGARLEIGPAGPTAPTDTGDAAAADRVSVANAVNLGALGLRFEGDGWLEGRRPLLRFRFGRLMLRLGSQVLLERGLPAPDPRRMPFFALIGASHGKDGAADWLAARGRGGGLALWIREREGSGRL